MKLSWLWIVWFVASPARGETPARVDLHGNTAIRVLLDKASRTAVLESKGATLYIKAKHPGSWVAVGKRATLTWAEKTKEIRLEGEHAKIAAAILFVRGGPSASDTLSYRGADYRGLLKLSSKEEGWTAVNVLGLEEYLAGTLAAEMNADWRMEALKAQAVASRTYALQKIRHPKNVEYDLMGTVEDQVYSGAASETKRIREAVESTRGQYLARDGLPAKIFFHSRCGGQTEPEETVWNAGKSHHVTVTCPYCRANPYDWKFSIPTSDLLEALKLPQSAAPKLLALDRSPTGRLSSLKVEAAGRSRLLDANTLRSLLGYQRLKSAHFQWKAHNGQIHFSGRGAGHGVGMCQWGASYLARQGKGYREILSHYYPQLTLEGASQKVPGKLEAKNRWR
jgi:stage II sporulation protein D